MSGEYQYAVKPDANPDERCFFEWDVAAARLGHARGWFNVAKILDNIDECVAWFRLMGESTWLRKREVPGAGTHRRTKL